MAKSLENYAHGLTDKNTTHTYLQVYDELFRDLHVESLLEVGISTGASLYMFARYFDNAQITGIDITDKDLLLRKTEQNIKMIFEDAYNSNTLSQLESNYDIILDDGSHKEHDLIKFLVLYMNKFNHILIIEDIYAIEICNFLLTLLPPSLKKHVTVYDRRQIKSRFDDILFVINKNETLEFPTLKTYLNETELRVSELEERRIFYIN